MSDSNFCVYNLQRESFLSLAVGIADTHWSRLRGLLGRLRLKSGEGLWVVPSRGIHTIGVLFPIDLVYLDQRNRVVHLVEQLGTFRISPIRTDATSVIELKAGTIRASRTQVGDYLLICSPDQLAEHFKGERATAQEYRPTLKVS